MAEKKNLVSLANSAYLSTYRQAYGLPDLEPVHQEPTLRRSDIDAAIRDADETGKRWRAIAEEQDGHLEVVIKYLRGIGETVMADYYEMVRNRYREAVAVAEEEGKSHATD